MSNGKKRTDEQLIHLLNSGGKQLEMGMHYLYHDSGYRKDIIHFLNKRGSYNVHAEDIFQEGICQLVINIKSGKFKNKSTLKTYLTGICQNILLNQIKKDKQQGILKKELKEQFDSADTPNEQLLDLNGLLTKIKSDCRSVLSLWALSYSMEEIAIELGYKNEHVASKKKHLCLKKLKLLIQKNYKFANQWTKSNNS